MVKKNEKGQFKGRELIELEDPLEVDEFLKSLNQAEQWRLKEALKAVEELDDAI